MPILIDTGLSFQTNNDIFDIIYIYYWIFATATILMKTLYKVRSFESIYKVVNQLSDLMLDAEYR